MRVLLHFESVPGKSTTNNKNTLGSIFWCLPRRAIIDGSQYGDSDFQNYIANNSTKHGIPSAQKCKVDKG